jgi:hypothetical protein
MLRCTGEAGIGKTRLAEETAALAAARGAAVAWARSSDGDIAPPYGVALHQRGERGPRPLTESLHGVRGFGHGAQP